MTFIQTIVIFFIFDFYIYIPIDRICKCVEHCATARAYSHFRENGVLVKMDDVEAGILKNNREKENVKEMLHE